MAELWATNELPGVAWNDEPPDNTPDPDLWGQAVTYWQTKTMTTLTPSPEYL